MTINELTSNRSVISVKFLMEIQAPHYQEERQFRRIEISGPQKCHINVPQSPNLSVNQGIIQNISLGGIYFLCDEELPIEKGDILDLIIEGLHNDHKIYRLILHGLVVRNDKSLINPYQFAVAFKFLSDPIYYPLKDINYNEFWYFDKIRILCQHYQLFKKAFKNIERTADIRNERIKNMK